MKTWIALFRGINVGGNSVIPMKELIRSLETAGFEGVRTYIQSGNIVFRYRQQSPKTIARGIARAIRRSHDFEPFVIVLGARELEKAASSNPYPDADAEPKFLHLFFLSSVPAKERLGRLEEMRSDTERFSIVGNVLYLHAPDGVGNSKFAKGAEKAMGVEATARNWRTITKLIDLANDV